MFPVELKFISPAPELSWSAIKTIFNLPEFEEIELLILILLCAFNVNVVALEPVFKIVSLTVISPFPEIGVFV